MHVYTSTSIQRAIAAGVKCIEHGHLMDEPTAKLIAEKGIWLSTQAFPDEMADAFPPGSLERAKALEVFAGTDSTFALAKKTRSRRHSVRHPVLPGAGAAPGGAAGIADPLVHPRRNARHGDWDQRPTAGTVREAQSVPGKLGVVEEGALADLLLVDGDPIANIELIEDPEKNLLVIMKDGSIYKNACASKARSLCVPHCPFVAKRRTPCRPRE